MGEKFIPRNKFKYLYYRVISVMNYLVELTFPPHRTNYRDIPIIINNYNRLSTLKKMIRSLEARGYNNIYIIDNNSGYPPLLEFYKTCGYKIFRLDSNAGWDALWKTGIYKKFKNDFFVYSDSDIVPVEECPDDFLLFFLNTLKKYRLARKVGFSLKIDDLPDRNLLKDTIIKCEEHFFRDFRKDDLLYRAPIDTTFALYRPRGKRRHANNHIEMYRTGFPYMARHLPWYNDSLNPDEEEKYYLEHLQLNTFWSIKSKNIFENKGDKNPDSVESSTESLTESVI